ncbi:MAG: tetratricopeptide repeat protein [Desulfobacteraceae bacterium]|nr:MAG: tetratricopeptide repeat protein [Desulfobacteraceae bacterium]
MKARHSFYIFIAAAIMGLVPGVAAGGDTNVIIHQGQTGDADKIYKLDDFDYELQQRERESMKQWNIQESMGAVRTGDVYFDKGEIGEAIYFYQIAIKIDPNNPVAHEKYIHAKKIMKQSTSPHYSRAIEYYGKGMKKKAIDELVLELKENPGNEEARMKLNEIESE